MRPSEEQTQKIAWTKLPLNKQRNNGGNVEQEFLKVSNSALAVPKGLDVKSNFVSPEEGARIMKQADNGQSAWEGFEQRRRVQRWSRDDPELPACLREVTTHFEEQTGHFPLHVSIEEYPESQLQRHFNASNKATVTTFESPSLCSCTSNECSCFVAALPIASSLIESLNKPKRRSTDCWDLCSSDQHMAGLLLQRHSLYIKTKEYLWEWRSRITSMGDTPDESFTSTDASNSRSVLVRFTRLPITSSSSGSSGPSKANSTEQEDSEFGYRATPKDLLPRTEEMPRLEDLLTVIVTTSPIKSNPSTELLERVFDTFHRGGHTFAIRCRKVIICDGCREKSDGVSKRHVNTKQALRNGIVDPTQLQKYVAFKDALRTMCTTAPADSPFYSATVEELETRHGYGFALRHALRECVQTPYVMVIQHDRAFMRTCPIEETVRTMWHHRNIKYVGMSMRSNLLYRDQFLGKYGRSYKDAMAGCTLRPPELVVDADAYGPDSASTRSMDCAGQKKLRDNIHALQETYQASQQNTDHLEWVAASFSRDNDNDDKKWQLSLTPIFFWYDNVHICETEHYRDFVFNPKFKMVVRGGFVEDKLSPVIRNTVERFGLAEGHARFGCYLLDDHSGMFFTGHLDGGSYLTQTERKKVLAATNKK